MKKSKLMLMLLLMCIVTMFGVKKAQAASRLEIKKLQYNQSYSDRGLEDCELECYSPESFDVRAKITENDNESEIGTTYANYGYATYIKVNDQEQFLLPSTPKTLNDINASIEIIEERDDKVVVSYKLKNNSTTSQNVSIASVADVEVGDNDHAAILKKDNHNGFTITQDDSDLYGFSTSFDILLTPASTTTWIGAYYGEEPYDFYRYKNGEISALTFDDYTDSALTYSWTYNLSAGEEKIFTAIFTVTKETVKTINFYAVDDYENIYTTKEALTRGALLMPSTTGVPEQGYNYKWNSKKDGSGYALNGNEYTVYDGTENYYEYKYLNDVVVKPNKSLEKNVFKPTIDIPEEIVNQYQDDAKNAYSDIVINGDFYGEILNKEDSNSLIEDYGWGDFLQDDEFIASYFQVYISRTLINQDGDNIEEPINDEVEITLDIPEKLLNQYNTFRVVAWDSEDESQLIEVDSIYNRETNKLVLKSRNGLSYLIIGSNTEIPDSPKAGVFGVQSINQCKTDFILVCIVSLVIVSLSANHWQKIKLENQ